MACDYLNAWFYLFLFTVILFIIFIMVTENNQSFKDGTGMPSWVWFLFVLMIIFLFISFILYYYVKQCNIVQPVPVQPAPAQPLPVQAINIQYPQYQYEVIEHHEYPQYEPCAIPIDLVEQEIIYEEDETIYKYTSLDNIPFSALNPFV